MITNCNVKIPKKYQPTIREIDYESREDGYWVYLNDGYKSDLGYGSQTIHEYTQQDLLRAIRGIVKTD